MKLTDSDGNRKLKITNPGAEIFKKIRHKAEMNIHIMQRVKYKDLETNCTK